MTEIVFHALEWKDWLHLFTHYLGLSLLTIGGALVTAPEMHRYLVEQQGWLTDAQFTSSIAIAQAAPGPNILFVALIGWNIGMNAGGIQTALLGVLLTMTGLLMPSTLVTYLGGRWCHQHRHLNVVRAFKAGMGPVVISLLIATGWIMASAYDKPAQDRGLWLLIAASMLIVLLTRLHLLWLLAAGALLGGLGLV